MYAETGLLFPFLQGCPAELLHSGYHPLQEELIRRLQIGVGRLPDGAAVTTVTEYDLGAEGDLFKAPAIIEEPVIELDPMAAAFSFMTGGDDITAAEAIKGADMDSIQGDQQPLSEVFYECKRDLLAKSVIEDVAFTELPDIKMSPLPIWREENFLSPQIEGEKFPPLPTEEREALTHSDRGVDDGLLQKSVSSGCLMSLGWSGGGSTRPNFLDFQGMDLGAVFGMRRAHSEGDIQTLGNGGSGHVGGSIVHPPFGRLSTVGDHKIEERRQKLSRYRKKKSERNFGRKIKYACRKALADSQPRVRGRFARPEDCEVAKPMKQLAGL